MKIEKKDIKTMQQVGMLKSDPIFHICTKGGFNIMALKKASGELRVLGTAAHRAIAKGIADRVEKGIEWHESLYKSEDMSKAAPQPQAPVSNPENHKAMANWHAHFSHYQKDLADAKQQNGQFDANERLASTWHRNEAEKHYQMAGMDPNQATEAYKAQHMYNKGQDEKGQIFFNEQAPFHSSALADEFKKLHNHIPHGHLGSRGLD